MREEVKMQQKFISGNFTILIHNASGFLIALISLAIVYMNRLF